MFTFNFLPDDNDDQKATSRNHPQESSLTDKESPPPLTLSHPFSWKTDLASILEQRALQEIVYQDVDLFPATGEDDDDEDEEDSSQAEPLRRVCMEQYEKEVTPGVYEGGLQVWECSLDLVRYFQRHKIGLSLGDGALELGCGHALPGCWLLREALARHCSDPEDISALNNESAENNKDPPFSVAFVDYNDYVIDDVTLSNIVLNTCHLLLPKDGDGATATSNAPTQLALQNVLELGSGDWHDMSRQLQGRRFDCIVAAETTYTPHAAKDTAELLFKHLTIDKGTGWIASKRYYFGVGGGSDALREAAEALNQTKTFDLRLKTETVEVIDSGVGNIREILKVTLLSCE